MRHAQVNFLDSHGETFHAVAVFGFNIRCAAVIPCFNERARIAPLVRALRRQLATVLVVDDGSTDETAPLAENAGAVVLRHGRNSGKGAALKTGLARTLEFGCDWAVTLDGDGQHAPEDVPALWRCAEATGARLVIGNRMDQARKMSWGRRQVNSWMSLQLSRRAGKFLPDTQSGFRLIHLPTWSALSVKSDRFEIESEMLMAFLAAKQRVEFVPVRVICSERSSHIRPLADSLRWFKWYFGFAARRGTPATNLFRRIPNVFSAGVDVAKHPAGFDPRQTVGE